MVFDEFNLYQVDFPWRKCWGGKSADCPDGIGVSLVDSGEPHKVEAMLWIQWQILQAYEQGVVQIEDSLKREATHTPMQNWWLFSSDISFLIIIINDNDTLR